MQSCLSGRTARIDSQHLEPMHLAPGIAARHVLNGDSEVRPFMRPEIFIGIAGGVLGFGTEVRLDVGAIFARTKFSFAGNFLDSGFGQRRTGLRRNLQRRVIATLPYAGGIRGAFTGLGSRLRTGASIALLAERELTETYCKCGRSA